MTPASYHQERLWFIDKFERGFLYREGPTYHNIPLILTMRGVLNVKALEAALLRVIRRHDALRTRVVTVDDKPWQLPHTIDRFTLKEIHTARFEGQDEQQRALSLAIKESQIPFDLGSDLLIRGTLIHQREGAVLVITAHHIIADAFSMNAIADEVLRCYDAALTGRDLQLADPVLTYADFGTWQKRLPDDTIETLLFYWRSRLNGRLQPLELPMDTPRVAVHVYEPGSMSFDFSEELSLNMRHLSEQTGYDCQIVLLAAFQVLLARYAGQEEVVVGTSAANRRQSAMHSIMGPLANLLVIRSQVTGTLTFLEVMRILQKTFTDALKHQDMPFDKLVDLLKPDKDMSRTALFDVLFRYEDAAISLPVVHGVEVMKIETNLGWGKYDLNLLVCRDGASFRNILVYNAKYFLPGTIERMVGHFKTLLNNLVKDPGAPLASLPLITATETEKILKEWNNTRTNYPATTLYACFAEQVLDTPDHVALLFGDEQFTYAEVESRAALLATYLLNEFPVRRGDKVTILLGNSPWTVIAILAVLRGGMTYVPVDPAYPRERINFLVADSRSTLIIMDGEGDRVPDGYHGGVADLRAIGPDLLRSEKQVTAPEPSSMEDVAYVIYTSGTTGNPKGCQVTHENVVRLMKNNSIPFDFTNQDVWIVAHSFCFDFSVWEMYGALLYGGKLIIPEPMGVKDVGTFRRLIRDHRVSILNQTPAAFSRLIEVETKATVKNLDNHLRVVIFGGDRLNPSMLKAWIELYAVDRIRLVNMFGITETTVHVTYHDLTTENILGKRGKSIIGVPLPDTTVYICDEHMNLLPPGIKGEMFVGGGGVSKGYLHNDTLTQSRFLPSPFCPGERLYRTGDLAQWLSDGTLEYLGRKDDQVKIRGYRIEPREIEQNVRRLEGVSDAVVIAMENQNAVDQCLVAYVVASVQLNHNALRSSLAELIPDYMMPAYFIQLDKLPLTHNGKVNKRALPDPRSHALRAPEAFVDPRNEIENTLLGFWREVLGREKISVHDNFFDIGGNSLRIIRLFNLMENLKGDAIRISQLYSHPSIAAQAGLFLQQQEIQIEKLTEIDF